MDLQFPADPGLLPRATADGVRVVFHAAPGIRTVALANLSAATLAVDAERPRTTPLYAKGWDAAAATLAPHGWLIATCGP